MMRMMSADAEGGVGGGESAEEDCGHLEDDGAVGQAAVVKDTGQQVNCCSKRVGLGKAEKVTPYKLIYQRLKGKIYACD